MGDTLTSAVRPAAEPLPGYRDPKPMVYAGLFPIDNAQFPELRDALDKLKLNDAALIYTPETSVALGFGFRCGFLGLLHMEIVNERLSREFGLDLIQTAPNVTYDVTAEDGSQHHVTNPSEFPDGKIKKIVEPMVAADIITPKEFIGAGDGSVPGPPWHYGHDGVHLHRSCRDALPHSAGGNRVRLLRPAQVPHQGLRFP